MDNVFLRSIPHFLLVTSVTGITLDVALKYVNSKPMEIVLLAVAFVGGVLTSFYCAYKYRGKTMKKKECTIELAGLLVQGWLLFILGVILNIALIFKSEKS